MKEAKEKEPCRSMAQNRAKADLIVLAISIAALLVACGALSVSLYMLNS
ncbi:hypothetical protein [Megasphaera sp.]